MTKGPITPQMRLYIHYVVKNYNYCQRFKTNIYKAVYSDAFEILKFTSECASEFFLNRSIFDTITKS